MRLAQPCGTNQRGSTARQPQRRHQAWPGWCLQYQCRLSLGVTAKQKQAKRRTCRAQPSLRCPTSGCCNPNRHVGLTWAKALDLVRVVLLPADDSTLLRLHSIHLEAGVALQQVAAHTCTGMMRPVFIPQLKLFKYYMRTCYHGGVRKGLADLLLIFCYRCNMDK